MTLKVTSNVKQITSGQVPNASTLAPGELAFGLITEDSKYHLYGNNNGTVIDLTPQSSGSSAEQTFDEVLTAGNTTGKIAKFVSESSSAEVSSIGLAVLGSDSTTVKVTITSGFTDNEHKVLSSNPDTSRDLSATEQETVRTRVDVYSKAEVDALVSSLTAEISKLQKQLSDHMVNVDAHTNMNVSDEFIQ